jgi:hypothetical protein
MASAVPRRRPSESRLRGILLLLIIWEGAALLAELTFGGPLANIDGDRVGGLLAARLSFGGWALVMMAVYIYAFIQGPLRHRIVLWLAVMEQLAGAVFAAYHATSSIELEGAVIPLLVSLSFLVLLLASLPRQQTTS